MIGNVIFIFMDCFDILLQDPQTYFGDYRYLEVLTKKGKLIFRKSE